MWKLLILAVGLVLLVVFWRARLAGGGTEKPRRPEDILEEVQVCEAYGRKAEAIRLLEQAVSRFPDNKLLRERLSAMQSD